MYVFFSLILGITFGSFLNALVWRIHERKPIVLARSECPHCGHKLAWRDNIPLFSFIFLKRRCRYCQYSIAWQYFLIELFLGIAFGLVAWYYGSSFDLLWPEIIRDWLIVFILTFIFVYDLRYGEILDRATLIPALILFVASLFFGWQSALSMLIGIGIAAGFFLLQFIISKGKWIGGGDVRLGVLMGVILGWPKIVVALFIAYALGALVSLCLVVMKKKKLADATPFGTYLTIGTLAGMFGGGEVVQWYVW